MAFNTDKSGDKAVEQSLKTVTALMENLEEQAKNSDKAVRGFGKSLDDIARKQNKFNTSAGRFRAPSVPHQTGGVRTPKVTRQTGGVTRASGGSKQAAAARESANALTAFATLNKLNKSALSVMPKSVAGLTTAAGKAAPAVSLLVGSIYAVEKAGKAAYERNMEVRRSLEAMRQSADGFVTSSGEQAASMNRMSNQWKTMGEDIKAVFEPVFGLFLSAAAQLSSLLRGIVPDTNSSGSYTGSSSAAQYASEIERTLGIPAADTLKALSEISSTAQQVGFDAESAANLAIGTYNDAIKKADELGLKAEDVAKKLSDAWRSGSDAAKEYGIVLTDDVLRGWMSENGIDTTREMSDAMLQSYRYQLMQEQLAADNGQALSEDIKRWAQLGDQINQAKQSLFSFDEVINTSSKDTSIPTIAAPAALDASALSGAQDAGFGLDGLAGLLAGLAGAAGAIAGLMKLLDLLKNWKKVQLLDDALLAALPGLITNLLNSIPKTVKVTPEVDRQDVERFTSELNNAYPRDLRLNFDVNEKALKQFEDYIRKTFPYNMLLRATVEDGEAQKFTDSLKKQFPYKAKITSDVDKKAVDALEKQLKATFPYTAAIKTVVDAEPVNSLANTLNSLFPYTAYVDVIVRDNGLDALIAKLREALDLSSRLGADTAVSSNGGSSGSSSAHRSGSGNYSSGSGYKSSSGQSSNFYGIKLGDFGLGVSYGFATGGIGTQEMDARLFEGNKKEAVIPLETSEGVSYLANAMQEAGAGSLSGGDSTSVTLNLTGIFDTDDVYKWRRVATKIGEQLDILRGQRGALDYGTK